jgi:serine/threonine-protein kinase RsbT
MTGSSPRLEWTLTREEDSYWISGKGRELARDMGFPDQDCWAVAITISELVSNAIKFAGKGTLRLRVLQSPRAGLEVRMQDDGPGIEDFDAALTDGYSEGHMLTEPEYASWPRRGLGSGLGAVKRLMDELTAERPSEGGTVVIARKYLPEGT